MRNICLLFTLFLFLVSCGVEEFPSQPIVFGPEGFVGKAAGMTIPHGQLPYWASSPKFMSYRPPDVAPGEDVRITVGDFQSPHNFDYVYDTGYLFDKRDYRWVAIDSLESSMQGWVKDRASFSVDAVEAGNHYFLAYACRNVADKWDCNGGPGNKGKWMLFSFDVKRQERKTDSLSYYRNLSKKDTHTGSDTADAQVLPSAQQSVSYRSADKQPKTKEDASRCAFICCSDSDCNDNNVYTRDVCYQPSSASSRCENFHDNLRTNYYDICWDHDCSASIPYPKKTMLIPSVVEVNHDVNGVGNVNAVVVFLYSQDPLPADKLQVLEAGISDKRSLSYGVSWFNDMARQYGVNLNLNLDFSSQQYKVPPQYVVHTYEDSFSKNLRKFIVDSYPQYANYDVIVPFYYSSSDISFANHVSGHNSFTLFSKQAAPDFFYPSFDEGTTSYSSAFAHEMAHIFGATDKYTCLDPTSQQCTYAKQQGIGCIIPGAEHDIMCHRVPYFADGIWLFSVPELNELTIIESTAKELGWFDMDGDGLIDAADPCPFLKENNC